MQSAPSAPVLVAGTVRDEDTAGAQLISRWRRHVRPDRDQPRAPGPGRRPRRWPPSRQTGPDPGGRRAAVDGDRGQPAVHRRSDPGGVRHRAPEPIRADPHRQALITARLDRLSPTARTWPRWRPGSAGRSRGKVLAAATGRAEDDLVDELDKLWRRRVMREQGTGYDFRHDRLRTSRCEESAPARGGSCTAAWPRPSRRPPRWRARGDRAPALAIHFTRRRGCRVARS